MKYFITLLLIIMSFVCGMNWGDREPVIERVVLQCPTIREFQEYRGITADGKVGAETIKELYEHSEELDKQQFNQYGIENMEQAGDMPE